MGGFEPPNPPSGYATATNCFYDDADEDDDDDDTVNIISIQC